MLAEDSLSSSEKKKKGKKKAAGGGDKNAVGKGAAAGAASGFAAGGPIGAIIGGVAGGVMGNQQRKGAADTSNRPKRRRLQRVTSHVREGEQRRASALAALGQATTDFASRIR